jgi:hypothetical protein
VDNIEGRLNWRNVFIQQKTDHAFGPRRKANLFRGRPGLSPTREKSLSNLAALLRQLTHRLAGLSNPDVLGGESTHPPQRTQESGTAELANL